ncbi:MAG: putative Ig domain-containing protein, partial [Terracidiphilus sp.]
MLLANGSILSLRSAGHKFSLLALALVTLLLPAMGRAQGTCSNTGSGASTVTTCTGGPAISFTTSDSSAQSSSITLPSSAVPSGGLVKTVVVSLQGVKSDGVCNPQGTVCNYSMQFAEFMLKAPNGTEFVLLGSTGDSQDGCDGNPNQSASCNGLQGSTSGSNPDTITISDAATSAAPYDLGWLTSSMPYTVKPSSYYYNNYSEPPPLPGGNVPGDFPQTDGCSNPTNNPPLLCSAKTLNSAFLDASANGAWTLYLIDNDSPVDPVSITGWSLTITYNITTAASTTTVLSSSAQPATYANSASSATVTFAATVSTANAGTPTGTVAFSANGSSIGGCSAQPLSGSGNSSKATCTGSVPQGNNSISAVYTPSSGFGPSSNTMTELVEVTPSNPSGNQWCNNSIITDPIGAVTPLAYPSVIKINDSAYNNKSVANVTVSLNGVAGSQDGIGGQFLLVGPGGGSYNLDFLDSGFGDPGPISAMNLTFEDLDTPNYVQSSTTLGYQPTNNSPYSATDDNGAANPDTFPVSLSPGIDNTIPQIPGTLNFAPPYGTDGTHYTHNGILTFGTAFNGASANGSWSLYTISGEPLTVNTGWCITLSLNTGNSTTTTLTPSSNPATFGAPVMFTATVESGGSPVTSGGTVTFLDNDAVPAGTVSGNNVVTLPSSGTVTFTTSSLTEGDHVFTATYSGTASDNASFSPILNQRINHATTVTRVSSTEWQYCNPGAVEIQKEAEPGPFTPNPSNIFVTNLPGSFESVGVQLTNFSVTTVDDLDELATLVEGPTPGGDTTGPALDFFSNTTQASNGNGTASLGNYIFDDGASGLVSSGNVSISPGTYKPTAYESYLDAPDSFTSSASGFYPAPAAGQFSYAQPNSLGTSQTFADVFPSGSSVNGTWSLFFSSGFANATLGAANGWCVDMNVTAPVLAKPSLSHVGNFAQGESNAQYQVSITNNGPGSTGDPTGGTYPMTVTDSLSSLGVTYSGFSGTGWNCTAASGTVTCTNDSAVAEGSSYPELTIEVNIPNTLTGQITNQITAGGAGTSNATSNSDAATIDVAPAFTSGSSTTFTVGTAGTFSVTASGTPAPTFSVTTGSLPSGVTLSSAGLLSGTPAAGTGGTYPVTITATNGTVNATQNFTLTVHQAPSITSAAGTTFTVGTAGSFSVTATGFPAPTFSVTGGTLPSGVTLTSGGSLSGTPAAGTGGSYPITITAANGTTNATQSFTLTVDQASAITSGSSTTFTVGTAGSFNVTATGNPAPTFSITAGTLPSGVTLSTAGVLSGTPAAGTGGTYPITITASNGVGTNATQTFTLTVDQAPAITSASSTTFAVGTAGSFSFTATGYPTTMTYSVTAGSLPSGVTLSSAGLLSGTPAAATGGTYPITVTASNGVGTAATQSFTLAVNQAPAFSLGATGSGTMAVNTPNIVLIFTSGYPTAAITESGALPTGVTFVDNGNGHGTLSGTPGATTGGLYNLVFTASNGISPNATLNYALTIKQPIAFTSVPATTFTAGTAGSFTLTTTGYPAPTFSETGALPTGVTLSSAGVLSGTPAAGTGGTYSITIQATNGFSTP